ncbi:hypothetical protein BDW66DRAFT_129491 [Aspergillus desertorum]
MGTLKVNPDKDVPNLSDRLISITGGTHLPDLPTIFKDCGVHKLKGCRNRKEPLISVPDAQSNWPSTGRQDRLTSSRDRSGRARDRRCEGNPAISLKDRSKTHQMQPDIVGRCQGSEVSAWPKLGWSVRLFCADRGDPTGTDGGCVRGAI